MTLQRYLEETVARFPARTAVLEPGHASIDYRTLGELSDRLRDRLIALSARGAGPPPLKVRKLAVETKRRGPR